MPDTVYVLTHGDFRAAEGDFTTPHFYRSDEAALAAAERMRTAVGMPWFRDTAAEDRGGPHVAMAWSTTDETRTLWLEELEAGE